MADWLSMARNGGQGMMGSRISSSPFGQLLQSQPNAFQQGGPSLQSTPSWNGYGGDGSGGTGNMNGPGAPGGQAGTPPWLANAGGSIGGKYNTTVTDFQKRPLGFQNTAIPGSSQANSHRAMGPGGENFMNTTGGRMLQADPSMFMQQPPGGGMGFNRAPSGGVVPGVMPTMNAVQQARHDAGQPINLPMPQNSSNPVLGAYNH